ncbi:MAG TPA: SCP2 sterol-binding domain-containing protein [Acidimicrobiales bacterium]|jgi:putative sterol carrier protein|nr:SCP2 sterol-binding domain-containing protein [Acidimicrobiales bacterium]
MPHPFLSDEWIEEAHAIRAELEDKSPTIAQSVRMNLVVTEIPFGQGELEAHMDTTAGELDIDKGHVEDADLKITLDYHTAKAILVDRNPQVGMQAFMAGKIRVEGDMAKLMAVQAAPSGEHAEEMAERLRAITE